jgi:NO-binding membrane sensor protein with MHYT domain
MLTSQSVLSSQSAAAASSSYDTTLVILSYVISVFGSLSALQSARRARSRAGAAAFGWLCAAAVSIGGGAIWSMHFIGMLAYHSAVHFSFDTTRTLLSLAVSIVAAGAGLYIASRGRPTVPRIAAAGTVTGLGVVAMHYLGMSAMRMNAALSYRVSVVALSVVVAVVAASAALFFAFTLRSVWAMIAAAFVMGIAVCGMHYTGMAAVELTPHTHVSAISGVDALSLALPVFGISSVLLFILLFVGLFQDAEEGELFVTA